MAENGSESNARAMRADRPASLVTIMHRRFVAGTAIAFAAASIFAISVRAETRLPEIAVDQMTPEQKRVADAILAGPRKSLSGPFNAWLRSPELADRLQKVGEYLRFETSLPHRLNELAILITARRWTAQFEWMMHYPLALQAGLAPDVAADLAQGKRPAHMKADEQIVYDFSTALHRAGKVPDSTYHAAVALLGERGVVELTALNGYYDLVSMTLGVAETPLPAGVSPPLPPIDNPDK